MEKQGITHIKDLKHDPRNARKHNPRNIGTIADSLQSVGAARSIVIDEDGVILAGNGVIEAAGQVDMTRVQVVDTDGDTIIAVRRSGLTPEQKTRLALVDNRANEMSDWDVEVLAELASEGVELNDLWSEEELTALLNDAPKFEPVGVEEQGRLDEKKKCVCPKCGHEFTP